LAARASSERTGSGPVRQRVCSVRETCRLQRRPVIAYLIDVVTAAQQRRPIPALVPT
jgi:hypothetical protein